MKNLVTLVCWHFW